MSAKRQAKGRAKRLGHKLFWGGASKYFITFQTTKNGDVLQLNKYCMSGRGRGGGGMTPPQGTTRTHRLGQACWQGVALGGAALARDRAAVHGQQALRARAAVLGRHVACGLQGRREPG